MFKNNKCRSLLLSEGCILVHSIVSAQLQSLSDRTVFDPTGTQSSHTIQKGLQVNNKALAEALQAEKENVRQAKAVILHLQQQQHVMLQHILLLRRKLKEQEAAEACRAPEVEPRALQLQSTLLGSCQFV